MTVLVNEVIAEQAIYIGRRGAAINVGRVLLRFCRICTKKAEN